MPSSNAAARRGGDRTQVSDGLWEGRKGHFHGVGKAVLDTCHSFTRGAVWELQAHAGHGCQRAASGPAEPMC